MQEQGTKTIEIVNGVPHFYLVIPCSPAEKPDGVTPLYLVKENEFGGPEKGRWRCRECNMLFHTRRSWEKHKGIKWIVQSGVKVCT